MVKQNLTVMYLQIDQVISVVCCWRSRWLNCLPSCIPGDVTALLSSSISSNNCRANTNIQNGAVLRSNCPIIERQYARGWEYGRNEQPQISTCQTNLRWISNISRWLKVQHI